MEVLLRSCYDFWFYTECDKEPAKGFKRGRTQSDHLGCFLKNGPVGKGQGIKMLEMWEAYTRKVRIKMTNGVRFTVQRLVRK